MLGECGPAVEGKPSAPLLSVRKNFSQFFFHSLQTMLF